MHILFVSPWFPFPPVNGSKIRINHLIKAVAEKHRVHLISLIRSGEAVDLNISEEICASTITFPWNEFSPWRWKAVLGFFSPIPRSLLDTYSSAIQSAVRDAINKTNPDVLIASELSTAFYAHKTHFVPTILEDLEISLMLDAWQNCSEPVRKMRRGLTWWKTASFIRTVLPDFHECTVVSEKEKEKLKTVVPNYGRISVIPNGVDIKKLSPGSTSPTQNTLIYSGSLTYSANYDAVSFFLAEIMPLIKNKIPNIKLIVTGSTAGVSLNSLPSGKNVVFSGFIPDIHKAVAGAWVCIVPLREGGGTRLKILEAMALGTPVVSTSKGAEGLDVTHGENILLADDPAEFASCVIHILQNPGLRAYLAQNARSLVEEKYGWEQIGRRFVETVERVAGQSQGG